MNYLLCIIKVCIACQYVFVADDWCGNRIARCVIHLDSGLGCVTNELRIVEFMSTILPAVHLELAIT
jgi:hypothetical protein